MSTEIKLDTNSKEVQFRVVPNTLRKEIPKIDRSVNSPLLSRLLADETVFIPITPDVKENALNKFYERARNMHKKLNKRKTILEGVTGYLMWFEEMETNNA